MRTIRRIIAAIMLLLVFMLPQISAQENAAPIHVVQTGENLASIARNFGVEVNLLMQVNNIQNARYVRTGQPLIIPLDGTAYTIPVLANGEPGAKTPIGREIVVVLSTQTAYAYENGVLQRSVTISSGAADTPTVQGRFRVYRKEAQKTLTGDGYSYPDVQWILYFYEGFALHSAYWHNDFGTPISHGCVNLRVEDAQWFYHFAAIDTPVTVIGSA